MVIAMRLICAFVVTFIAFVSIAVHAAAMPSADEVVKPSVKDSHFAQRPNFLWLTWEDASPHLGCYGERYARTPNLDRLAASGILYHNAFTTAGGCSPSRTCLYTGTYPTSFGTQNVYPRVKLPPGVSCFTADLRRAGYYCSNNEKTDYGFPVPGDAWDESSHKAHWQHRKSGQPFFAVFNFVGTHQSFNFSEQSALPFIRDLPADLLRKESDLSLPAYHPDTPETRRCWWRYHHLITAGDRWVGEKLAELERAGFSDDTIVFFTSDHGAGMPRGKTTLYDLGLHVPLIVRIPEKWKHLATSPPGSEEKRLVSFVDLGPTVLHMAGLELPEHMQGRPFLGRQPDKPRDYVFAARDRFGSYCQTIRAVRDKRYKYMRNYRPGEPLFPWNPYHEQIPVLQEMRRLAAAGELSGVPRRILETPRPAEELYDTENDPHEVNNLANSAEHRAVLQRMRAAHLQWTRRTGDLGLVPEAEMVARAGELSPRDAARRGEYPLERIRAAAVAADEGPSALPRLYELASDSDSAIRWWAVFGLIRLGDTSEKTHAVLEQAATDESREVRVAAACGLCRLGRDDLGIATLKNTVLTDNHAVRLRSLLVLEEIGNRARPALDVVRPLKQSEAIFVRWVAERVESNIQ